MIPELRTGGAERIAVTLAVAAADAGHTVAVAAGPGELEAELAPALGSVRYDVPVVGRRPSRMPFAALRVRRAVREFAPDVVHAHNPTMAVLVALAGCRRRSLVSVHGVPEDDWPATARLLRLARVPAVACGPGVAAALREHGCEPLATITNGVAPAPRSLSHEEFATQLGLRGAPRVVLSVGRLVEQKNHELAVRALAMLPADVHLVIVGEGPLRGALEELAASSGVAQRVVFTGRRPARELMSAADVICIPSRWEGLPLVILEAMSSGRPVVATAVRGIRELLDDGRTGLLTPPDDEVALADALRRALHEPVLAQSLARSAAAVAGEMTEEAMVRGYLRLYADRARRA